MANQRLFLFLVIGLLGVCLPACGGGSGTPPESSFRVENTAMSAQLSGETMDYVIPLVGGCGGPYVLSVIEGQLPPGCWLDSETHSIKGTLMEDGDYAFTVLISDSGCDPFQDTTASYTMSVGVGEIVVVGVELAGQPAELIPAGEGSNPAAQENPPYNPDHPALPGALFNQFIVLDLQVAGGTGPYRMSLYDDPDQPDGPLPFGTSVVFNSTSISGTPSEEAPDGGAFLITLEVEDAIGRKAHFTYYWLVYSPPLELVPLPLGDATAGEIYNDGFSIVGGVGPFAWELVDGLDSTTQITAADYPTGNGPDYATSNPGAMPEGLYVDEETGKLGGIARRRGVFKIFLHVYSTALSSSPLQNQWGEYTLVVHEAADFSQDASYTIEGSFSATTPYSGIPDAEQGVTYSLQLLAQGGVAQDGYTDAPHSGDRVLDPNEHPGPGRGYTWTIDWDPDKAGEVEIPHLELLEQGIFQSVDGEEDSLIPQLYENLGFTATDEALPAVTPVQQAETQKVRFSIGPDRIIVTQSSTSYTTALSYDNRSMNDTAMTVRVLIPSSQGNDLRAPNDSDLVGTGTTKIGVPDEAGTSTTIATLLSTLDLCRVSVNPTGWWDDTNHLNPRAARPFQHSDSNGVYAYYRSLAYAGTTYYLGSSSYSYRYQVQPTATCVRLPKVDPATVTPDKAKGIYNTGGKFYIFDSSKYFGIFIIRDDGRLYVPAAFDKSATGWRNFGDNWQEAYTTPAASNSINKLPQMTVSPDGRVATLKLKSSSTYSRLELADDSQILLVSLTGERLFDGEVYKIIETGSDGSPSEGQYQFASSLTLTNGYLYYMIGSGSTSYLYFEDHYIYRYDLFGGDGEGALLHENFSSDWTNTTGSPMQTPFQSMYYDFKLYSGPDPQTLSAHGHNAYESSLAPHPFRVNADGNACAILAGVVSPSGAATAWDYRYHHAWVDYEGDLKQLTPAGSGNRRHFAGGGRGIQLTHGPSYGNNAYLWGHFDGPTSRFEISDDGQAVAAVYTRYNNGSSTYWPRRSTTYSTTQYRYRQDIVAFKTTDAWSNVTTHEISGDASQNYQCTGEVFQDSIRWRFGALTFTAAGDGLVFWGGYSNYSPTASSNTSYYKYYAAMSFVGSLYSYQFSNSAVKNILSSSDGGCNKTVGSALTSISYSTGSWQRDGGVIKPVGGWISPNRNFLYVITKGALHSSTGSRRDGSVLGVNIRSLDTTKSIGSGKAIRTDGRAFQPTGLATTNGFYPVQYYIAGYSIGYYYYSSIMQQYYQSFGDTQRAAATDNGWVYFVSEKSVYGYTSTYASSAYGGCINATYYTYNYLTKHLYMFDQDLGANINTIAGDSWSGSTSYHTVGYIDVADDGKSVSAVDSTARYYDWNNSERLTVWSGIQLDTEGKLVGTPKQDRYENGVFVGSTSTFTPQNDRIIYAAGGGNENGKKLYKGMFNSTGAKTDFGFSTKNYNVLHAGR